MKTKRQIHQPGHSLFGFKYRFPQAFLDELAKAMGIKWVRIAPRLINKEDIEVHPLPPPMNKLFYCELKTKKQ